MRKPLLTIAVLAFVTAASFIVYKTGVFRQDLPNEVDRISASPAYKNFQNYSVKEEEEEGIKPALEYLNKIRANQVTGQVPLEDVLEVRQEMKQLRSQTNKRGALNLQWEAMGPDNVGGRTRSLWIDPNNPDFMLAGSVSGGLFKSNDGGLSWMPHDQANDLMGHLGISCIRQASNGDIYIGTGEEFAPILDGSPSDYGAPGFIGGGIFKSTDGGTTFVQLPSTVPTANSNNDTWSYVSEIAIDPNNPSKIYASTHNGLKISSDGGSTWTDPMYDVNPIPLTANSFEVAISSNGIIHAEVDNRYYRSTDGTNFTNQNGEGGFPSTNIGRIEFALSAQDPNYVYAVVSTAGSFGGSELNGIYQSKDAGLTWTALIPGNSATFDVLGNQGTWNVAVGVDPQDKDRLIVGGQLELWSGKGSGGWDMIAFWLPDSPTNPYYVHADMHDIVFHPTNSDIMFVVSDGGIFKSTNATQQFPTFTPRNKGYMTTQFYRIAASPEGFVMGGSQDNGTLLNDLNGNTRLSTSEVLGGDGGDCEFSKINNLALFASNISGRVSRSSNGGESFGGFFDDNIDGNGDGEVDGNALFIAPTALWEEDNSSKTIIGNDTIIIEDKRSIYFLGIQGRLWFTPGALNFSSQPYWYDVRVNGVVSEIEVADDGTVFCGTGGGNVYRILGINDKYRPDTVVAGNTLKITYVPDYPEPAHNNWSWPSSSALYRGIERTQMSLPTNTRFVTGIAIDPNNSDHVVATLGNYGNNNYVYRSTNATAANPTFTSVQNNLPKMPLFDVKVDYYNSNNIILGTELGIWSSNDGGTTWSEDNNGLASVPVFNLRQEPLYEDGCRVIYAGTHGRGIYRTTTLTAAGCNLVAGIEDDIPASDINNLTIYPNPVFNKASIELDLKKQANVKIQIVDLMGKVYEQMEYNYLLTGSHKLKLDFSNIASGIYLVVVQSGNSIQSKRVFVTK